MHLSGLLFLLAIVAIVLFVAFTSNARRRRAPLVRATETATPGGATAMQSWKARVAEASFAESASALREISVADARSLVETALEESISADVRVPDLARIVGSLRTAVPDPRRPDSPRRKRSRKGDGVAGAASLRQPLAPQGARGAKRVLAPAPALAVRASLDPLPPLSRLPNGVARWP